MRSFIKLINALIGNYLSVNIHLHLTYRCCVTKTVTHCHECQASLCYCHCFLERDGMKSFCFLFFLWNIIFIIVISNLKSSCVISAKPVRHPGKMGRKKPPLSRTYAAGFGCRQPPSAAPSINLSVMRWALRLHPQGQHTIWRSFWGFGQSSTVDWAAPLVYCYPDGLLPVKKNQ